MNDQNGESKEPVVLVIDDEEGIRQMLCQALEDEGFEGVAASNGVAGLMLMETNPADVVITDIIMPGLGGNEMIFTLRREFPDARIIAMSGGGRKGEMSFLKIAKKQGVDGIIAKPFDLDELVELVRDVLARGPRAADRD